MVDGTRLCARLSPLEREVGIARAALLDGQSTVAQGERTRSIIDRFVAFAEGGHGIGSLAEVSPSLVQAFIRAPKGDLAPPSVATMHWRRTALRLLFRAGREVGLVATDPTLDVRLPPRSSVSTRPLTEDEVQLCRAAAQWALGATRRATAWALAEATCGSSELPHITAADVDVQAGTVWISGGKRTAPRTGVLSDWGSAQVRRRIVEMSSTGEPLVYAGSSRAGGGQASCAAAIVDVLVRAGLHDEPDVRPARWRPGLAARSSTALGASRTPLLRSGCRASTRRPGSSVGTGAPDVTSAATVEPSGGGIGVRAPRGARGLR